MEYDVFDVACIPNSVFCAILVRTMFSLAIRSEISGNFLKKLQIDLYLLITEPYRYSTVELCLLDSARLCCYVALILLKIPYILSFYIPGASANYGDIFHHAIL